MRNFYVVSGYTDGQAREQRQEQIYSVVGVLFIHPRWNTLISWCNSSFIQGLYFFTDYRLRLVFYFSGIVERARHATRAEIARVSRPLGGRGGGGGGGRIFALVPVFLSLAKP